MLLPVENGMIITDKMLLKCYGCLISLENSVALILLNILFLICQIKVLHFYFESEFFF